MPNVRVAPSCLHVDFFLGLFDPIRMQVSPRRSTSDQSKHLFVQRRRAGLLKLCHGPSHHCHSHIASSSTRLCVSKREMQNETHESFHLTMFCRHAFLPSPPTLSLPFSQSEFDFQQHLCFFSPLVATTTPLLSSFDPRATALPCLPSSSGRFLVLLSLPSARWQKLIYASTCPQPPAASLTGIRYQKGLNPNVSSPVLARVCAWVCMVAVCLNNVWSAAPRERESIKRFRIHGRAL